MKNVVFLRIILAVQKGDRLIFFCRFINLLYKYINGLYKPKYIGRGGPWRYHIICQKQCSQKLPYLCQSEYSVMYTCVSNPSHRKRTLKNLDPESNAKRQILHALTTRNKLMQIVIANIWIPVLNSYDNMLHPSPEQLYNNLDPNTKQLIQ